MTGDKFALVFFFFFLKKLLHLYTLEFCMNFTILYKLYYFLEEAVAFLSLPWSSLSHVIRVPPSLDLGLRVTFFPLFFSAF